MKILRESGSTLFFLCHSLLTFFCLFLSFTLRNAFIDKNSSPFPVILFFPLALFIKAIVNYVWQFLPSAFMFHQAGSGMIFVAFAVAVASMVTEILLLLVVVVVVIMVVVVVVTVVAVEVVPVGGVYLLTITLEG